MDSISGDRRTNRRYGVRLNVRYSLVKGTRLLAAGTGTTRNISKGGVSFRADRILPRKACLELAIEWPSLLHGEHPLELHIVGRVLRSRGGETAIRTSRHSFVRVWHPESETLLARPMPLASQSLVM